MKCAREGCGRWAIKGGTICPSHGGANRRTRGIAAVRAEVAKWSPHDVTVDPGEQLLRLVAQSSRRAGTYAELLGAQYARAQAEGEQQPGDEDQDLPVIPAGVAALIGYKWGAAGKDGDLYRTEEAIRGLVALEADERDRCARFCKLAVDAGIAERQVRLAEAQGAAIVAVIRAVTAAAIAAGMPSEYGDVFIDAAPGALRELEMAAS